MVVSAGLDETDGNDIGLKICLQFRHVQFHREVDHVLTRHLNSTENRKANREQKAYETLFDSLFTLVEKIICKPFIVNHFKLLKRLFGSDQLGKKVIIDKFIRLVIRLVFLILPVHPFCHKQVWPVLRSVLLSSAEELSLFSPEATISLKMFRLRIFFYDRSITDYFLVVP